MTLLTLAIEYLLLHTIFETIRSNDEKSATDKKEALNTLNSWKPLDEEEWNNIRRILQ